MTFTFSYKPMSKEIICSLSLSNINMKSYWIANLGARKTIVENRGISLQPTKHSTQQHNINQPSLSTTRRTPLKLDNIKIWKELRGGWVEWLLHTYIHTYRVGDVEVESWREALISIISGTTCAAVIVISGHDLWPLLSAHCSLPTHTRLWIWYPPSVK